MVSISTPECMLASVSQTSSMSQVPSRSLLPKPLWLRGFPSQFTFFLEPRGFGHALLLLSSSLDSLALSLLCTYSLCLPPALTISLMVLSSLLAMFSLLLSLPTLYSSRCLWLYFFLISTIKIFPSTVPWSWVCTQFIRCHPPSIVLF